MSADVDVLNMQVSSTYSAACIILVPMGMKWSIIMYRCGESTEPWDLASSLEAIVDLSGNQQPKGRKRGIIVFRLLK